MQEVDALVKRMLNREDPANANLVSLKALFDRYFLYAEANGHTIAVMAAQAEQFAREARAEADLLFGGEILDRYRQALLYYSVAITYEALGRNSPDRAVEWERYGKAGEGYHFAGHAFRGVEDYGRAGDAYTRSGECYGLSVGVPKAKHSDRMRFRQGESQPTKAQTLGKAVGSYRRAKGVWDDVGDYQKAGNALTQEQRMRELELLEKKPLSGHAFQIWGILTGHGESFRWWSVALVAGLALFIVLNYLFPDRSAGSPLMLAFERALLISDAGHPSVLQNVQIGYSYFILGVGLALVVRRFGPR